MNAIPTVTELLALPYGDAENSEVLTTDDLLAMEYTGGPAFSRGLTASSYRERYRANGVHIRHLRSLDEARTQFLEVVIPDEVRVFVDSTTLTVQSEEFGEIAVGNATLKFLPDELSPVRNDRIVRVEEALATPEGVTFTSSGLQYDELPFKYIASILQVTLDGAPMRQSLYTLEGHSVRWMSVPPVGQIHVAYKRFQAYEVLGQGVRRGPLGADGLGLSVFMPLKELGAGEE